MSIQAIADRELTELEASLSVADKLRSQQNLTMPAAKLVLEFENMSYLLMRKEKFGRSSKVIGKNDMLKFLNR